LFAACHSCIATVTGGTVELQTMKLLRDVLLASLKTLPGTRDFHLHVLVTSPRKHTALYPFAHPRPRSYLQDIIVLLSEQATPNSPRDFVSAIEAAVYNVPITSCAILYISKVDTTGQGIAPAPTSNLLRALLTFYADPQLRPFPADHLWIHLFARAQGQYLFPNSADYEGKHPLTDVKLCLWWKRVFGDVAEQIKLRTNSKTKIKLFYILPGSSESEASYSLNFASNSSATSSSASIQWTYGHPYSQSEIPLPCPPSETHQNLGHFIPSFEDDPKSRFMEEIAYTTEADGIKSPARKRPRRDSAWGQDVEGDEKESRRKCDGRVQGELDVVTPDEFWERMSFRQECIAGTLTGFFAMGVSCLSTKDHSRSELSPLAPQTGQVPSQMMKRIMSSLLTGHEFSTAERCIRATGVLEDTIRGLCEGLKTVDDTLPSISSFQPIPSSQNSPERPSTPDPEHRTQILAPPHTPPPRMQNGIRLMPDVSPNPFPEPITSLETYNAHIYGSVHVDNPPLPPKLLDRTGDSVPQVTILTVKKKKKRI
jgi:regulator of Ty1 transposition protein 109